MKFMARANGVPPVSNECTACKCVIAHGASSGPYRAHLDHCHATDVNRGWLCQACNITLGFFECGHWSLDKLPHHLVDYLLKFGDGWDKVDV